MLERFLRALSVGSGGLAGTNLATAGLAGARGRPGMAAVQEAKLRSVLGVAWCGMYCGFCSSYAEVPVGMRVSISRPSGLCDTSQS